MKKKRIASRLLSLLLSAAVIVSSSFSGLTLMDVSAVQPGEEAAVVSVSQNEIEDVTEEDVVTVSENDSEITEEEVDEVEPVTEEVADEPEISATEPVWDSTMKTTEIVTTPQPYVSPDKYASADNSDDLLKMAEVPLSYDVKDGLATSYMEAPAYGVESTEGAAVEQMPPALPEKATTTPASSTLVTDLVAETALAKALLEIYNNQYNAGTDVAIGAFRYSHLTAMNGVVDLSTSTYAASVTKATGIGYLVNATEISLKGTKITYIPGSEFWKNSKLVTITLPDTLVGFGDSAFNGCTALKNINTISGSTEKANTLPSNLDDAKMGSNIFANCTALTTIAIPSMASDAYALRPATSMFNGCTALQTVTVGANVAVIPNSCFVGAGDKTNGLTVTFATGSVLDTLMDNAFQYCNITELDLSKCSKLSRIGVRCFTPRQSTGNVSQTTESTLALQKLIWPASNATIKANGVEIGEEAFFMTPLKTASYEGSADGKVILPNYVKSIGVAAFYGNDAMTSLQLSANLPLIPKFAFAECPVLTTITLDTASNNNACATVGIANQAFHNDAKLSNANFLAKMTKLNYIGEEMWDLEDNDKNLNVNVQTITYFSYKTNGYNKNLLYSSAVFTGTGITSASLPGSLRTVAACAFASASKLATVTWAADANLAAGATYKIATKAFESCTSLKTFLHPATGDKKVSFEIWPYAFAYDSALTNFAPTTVTDGDAKKNAMPVALTRLAFLSFGSCSALQYMKITDNVKGVSPKIERGVFMLSRGLTTVEMPKSTTIIPAQMFYDCGLTTFPTFNGGVLLASIGDGAFFGNKMTSVDLSAFTKLTYIGIIEFAYHDPYTEQRDSKGNKVNVVADEILTTVLDEVTLEEKDVAETTLAPLTTLILPDAISGSTVNMVWGNNMLQMAGNFKTLKTKSRGTANQVYIPNYIKIEGVGNCIFAGTAVTKAVWEFETKTSGANKWNMIPNGMFAFTPITDITACCIKPANLTAIGSLAYAGTQITALNFGKATYPKLKEMGDGVFAFCPNLKKVQLPDNGLFVKVPDGAFLVGNFENTIGLAVIDKDTVLRSVLSEIKYGTAKTIGKYAFATTDYTKRINEIGADYPDVLQKVDLSTTMVTTLEAGAFAGNTSLRSINLKKVTSIGDAAFRLCENLVLTYDASDATQPNPLGSSLQSIGAYAFQGCQNIGEVVFGSQLQSIGESAFDTCIQVDEDTNEPTENKGLTFVDFSKATKLATIGKNAFKDTAIKNFDISKTQVLEMKEGAVGSCPFLETITLNESMQRVAMNAAYGCISLGSFEFYSTTTVDLQAFYRRGNYKTTDENDKIVYITPIGKVDFRITPVELNVGLGNPMMFPYYVNDTKNGSGEFGEIVIGQASVGSENPTVHQYVKVMANTSKYYKNNTDPSNIVTDAKYFQKSDAMKYSVNNTTVYTFKIQGLKATPANTTVPFSVTSGYTFKADGNVSAEQKLTAKYNLKVLEIPYYPTFYTDVERVYSYPDFKVNTSTGVTTGTSNIRANADNPQGSVILYYDITPVHKTNWRPETGNLVIKINNPDVVNIVGSGVRQIDSKTYNMIAEPGTNETTLSAVTKGKTIMLMPKKQGTVTVTIYPENCPTRKLTWKVNFKSDIKEVDLAIPYNFNNGFYEGDNFPVINRMTFYVGGTLTRAANNLATYKQFTDNTISYFTNNSKLASVNSSGVLTIMKSAKKKQSVVYGCIVARPDGTKARYENTLEIKYPKFTVGATARSTGGDMVRIVTKASGKKPAEVIYTGPKETKTKVTVPRTMTVGGVKCKVVDIADGAFRDNKKVKTVKISKGFTKVPSNMFYGCTKLTKVTLPKTIVSIGVNAFYGCKKLTKITIPKNVERIEAYAFMKCSKLKKIKVTSKKVVFVGIDAFKGIHKKAVIDVPNNMRSTYKPLFTKGQGKKVKIK